MEDGGCGVQDAGDAGGRLKKRRKEKEKGRGRKGGREKGRGKGKKEERERGQETEGRRTTGTFFFFLEESQMKDMCRLLKVGCFLGRSDSRKREE